MSKQTNKTTKVPTAEEKAMEIFTNLVISKIENLSEGESWKKPWIGVSSSGKRFPKNLSGRPYSASNALMLAFVCDEKGYESGRFCTVSTLQSLNNEKPNLPRLLVNKGEHSYPVILSTMSHVNRLTKKRISEQEYNALSSDEKLSYISYPVSRVYRVFNIAQTNMKEARPEMWEKFAKETTYNPTSTKDDFAYPAVDEMIDKQSWICPINCKGSDQAFYEIVAKSITVPLKSQFPQRNDFYGVLFHEMAHSTGDRDCLRRFGEGMDGESIAREELVAELSSALLAFKMGIVKNLKEDSCAYLRDWLERLHESPSFLKKVLSDVKRAVWVMEREIDKTSEKENGSRGEDGIDKAA